MNEQKQITEVIDLWKVNKKQYVKKSSFSAYTLLIENHLLPTFGNKYSVEETEVQTFVFQKLEAGLSQKTIKDILIVLKMIPLIDFYCHMMLRKLFYNPRQK